MNDRFYALKIVLLDIQPEIWRRFVVPATITLDRLHDVIQIVMGWTDSHLHQFTIGKKKYTEYRESKEDGLPCGRYQLVDLIKQKGRTFQYLYDFGDNWKHELTIEDNDYFDTKQSIEILCLEGKRACPPEDIGGVHGYLRFCKIIENPDHDEHAEYKFWSGGNFDSENFNVKFVNRELIKYLRWSRDRDREWGWNY